MPRRGKFRFSTTIEARWRDTDPMGHVNNAVYFTYFEVGRVGYLRAIGLRPTGDPGRDYSFILVSAACEYLAPVKYGEKVTICVRVSRLGKKSFDVEYLLTHGRKKIATGRTVQVAYDYCKGETRNIPSNFRRAIRRYEGAALTPAQ